MAQRRRAFLAERGGAAARHVSHFSIDPATLAGNVENFIGVAQVPIGLAGPLRIRGEHADGDFYVPLATTEGTLGGQLQPRHAAPHRERWGAHGRHSGVDAARARVRPRRRPRGPPVRRVGRRTLARKSRRRRSRRPASASSQSIGQYSIGPLRYLRFNYTTGDAAGQNMTGKATLAACEWIKEHHPDHPPFILSGNVDTDKKHSQINMLDTRGRRVVAEAVIDKRGAEGDHGRRHRDAVLGTADLQRRSVPRPGQPTTVPTPPTP